MLQVRNMSKKYGESLIFSDGNIEINNGEVVSIVGPANSGKTTLLQILAGITPIDEGKILYNGHSIVDELSTKKNVVTILQDYNLLSHITVYENIVYGLLNHPSMITKEEIDHFITILNLKSTLKKDLNDLLPDEIQKVAWVRSLVMKPKVLLIDELLSPIEEETRKAIYTYMKTIARKNNMIIIFVYQNVKEAVVLSDKLLLVNKGKITQFDASEEMIEGIQEELFSDSVIS